MRLYELVVILKASVSDSERKRVIDQIKSYLQDWKITKDEDLGQRPLAYKIKQELAGVYHLFNFEGEKGITHEFEKRLVASEAIIRHLLLRKK